MAKTGFCIGVYDTCHRGHIRVIQAAAGQVKRLVVAVVADAAVTAQKGPGKPLFPLSHRLGIVEALKGVHAAIPSQSFDPYEAFLEAERILGRKIDIYFRGEDQDHIDISRILPRVTTVVTLARTPGISTTQILNGMARAVHDGRSGMGESIL